jgi:NAD(P)-dependent dehydrogenase (short-subunit alcohol dehydrogenase family)
MPSPKLTDRCAVITGASRGIGAGLASCFAEQGLRLGLCSRGEPALPDSEQVVSRRVDVREEAAIEGFAEEVTGRFGAIDLWINNAGVLEPVGPVRDTDVGAFRELIDINLTGVFLGSRAYIRHVRSREGGGVLINVSSGAAWGGYAGWSAYCASKAGVALLTQCVALEEAEHGLRAHALAPGVVDTDMQTMIRAASDADFPMRERFAQMKEDDAFNTIEFVARHVLALAFDPDRETDEVDIRLPDEKG